MQKEEKMVTQWNNLGGSEYGIYFFFQELVKDAKIEGHRVLLLKL